MFEKGISAYVLVHLPHFRMFTEEENKWDYFMKIVKMTPKKIGESTFLALLSENSEKFLIYKGEAIQFLIEK